MSTTDQDPAQSEDPGNQNPADASQASPQIQIAAQYIKDLSFENPNAPDSFMASEVQPHISISIDIDVKTLNPGQHEITLNLSAEAKRGEESLFLAELAYAGIFLLSNMNEDMLRVASLIECPRLLFPFARRVIGDVTRDGGFPPLLLEPIDFAALYKQQLANGEKSAGQ